MLSIIYVFFISLFLIGIKRKDCFVDSYLARNQCNIVKGLFIILVFISHVNQYLLKSGFSVINYGDVLYFRITSAVGQLMVVMFLFFSGFGIMESFKKKGYMYVAIMPRKRILTTLLNFDVAVLVFIALNLVLGKHMSMKQILLSFIAWDSVGNSNWYIFSILVCYSLAFVVLYVYSKYLSSKNIYIYALLPLFTFVLFAMTVLSYYKAAYWYNTMLCFPFGMLYSAFKDKIYCVLQSYYWIILFLCVIIFFKLRFIPLSLRGLFYNMESIVFAMIIVLLMLKFESNNKWFHWMGEKLFPLYIYQRLAMICIYELPGGKEFICSCPFLYILTCFICVLIISYRYHKWQILFH